MAFAIFASIPPVPSVFFMHDQALVLVFSTEFTFSLLPAHSVRKSITSASTPSFASASALRAQSHHRRNRKNRQILPSRRTPRCHWARCNPLRNFLPDTAMRNLCAKKSTVIVPQAAFSNPWHHGRRGIITFSTPGLPKYISGFAEWKRPSCPPPRRPADHHRPGASICNALAHKIRF